MPKTKKRGPLAIIGRVLRNILLTAFGIWCAVLLSIALFVTFMIHITG